VQRRLPAVETGPRQLLRGNQRLTGDAVNRRLKTIATGKKVKSA